MSRSVHLGAWLAGTASALALAGPAAAQSGAPASPEPPSNIARPTARLTAQPPADPAAAGAAAAAESAPPASPNQVEEIVVTGSRIVRNGNNSPTPVTVVSTEQLLATTPSSIPDGLNKLPQFAAAATSNSDVSGANGRGYRPSGNFLDLRGFGPQRTLVLEDGRRVPATFYDGTVDVDTLPQLLIQRVDVVTGGASAVYGSDAVTGVVNFLLDKTFNGLKGVAQGGISTYGDADSFRIGLAGGTNVGDRGHFEFSAETFQRDAIENESDRPYGDLDAQVVGKGTIASPYSLIYNGRISNSSFGGLVTTGPFAGMQFLPNGTLTPFNAGTPTATANIASGGDGGYLRNEYLLPSLKTAQAFARFDYKLTDTLSAFVQGSYAVNQSYSRNQNLVSTSGSNPITIFSGNAYLLPQYQAILDSTGTQSFNLNRYNEDFGSQLGLNSHTYDFNVTAGLNGRLGRFDWDAYYTHGEARTTLASYGNVNNARLAAAVDAVVNPANGQIVCRASLVAPNAYPGCVPIDVFGDGAPSEAARAYVVGKTDWVARNSLDDVGANITGALINDWAGPIKGAAGFEYRYTTLDETTNVPSNVLDTTNLRGNFPTGTLLWTKDVVAPSKGDESVYELNAEIDAPILRDLPLVKSLSINAAGRYTNYSVSGSVETWKAGLEWQVDDDLHIRATRSRDIRAPTLFDLFQGQQATLVGHQDLLTNSIGSVNSVTQGNPNLVPEEANTTTAGFVFQPHWIPRLSVAVDYYHIYMNNAIGTVSGGDATVETICNQSGGTSPLCGLIVRPHPITDTSPDNYPTALLSQKQNIALMLTEGVDVELNYSARLGDFYSALPGLLNARLLWTHQPTLKTQTLPGTVVLNVADTSQVPADRVTLNLDYTDGPLTIDFLERYTSPYGLSSNPNQVFAYGRIGEYWQTDVNLAYRFRVRSKPLEAFISVQNLFNEQGQLFQIPGYTGNPGMNYPIGQQADFIGRYITSGVRFNF